MKEKLRQQQHASKCQIEESMARLESAMELATTTTVMKVVNEVIGNADNLLEEFEDAKAEQLAQKMNIDSAFASIALDQEDANNEWDNGMESMMPDGTTRNIVKETAATLAASGASAAAAGGAAAPAHPSSYPAVAPHAVGTAPVAVPARTRSPARLPVPAEDSAEAEWNA